MNEQTAGSHSHEHMPHAACPHCICMAVGEEISNFFKHAGPSDAVKSHFRSARVEMLKGVRQIIDERIERINQTEPKGTKFGPE